MRRMRYKIYLILFLIGANTAYGQELVWNQVAPGIWKTVIGSPEAFNLLSAAESKPNVQALSLLPQTEFPLSKNEIVGVVNDGQTQLRFPLEREEQLFGFGLNFKTIHQRGRVMQLHVDHYGGKDDGRTHAPVPFYVSDRGYG